MCRQISAFSVQVPEHTWGLDVKTFLADYSNWSNKEFQGQLDAGAWNYRYCPALQHVQNYASNSSGCTRVLSLNPGPHMRTQGRKWHTMSELSHRVRLSPSQKACNLQYKGNLQNCQLLMILEQRSFSF